MPTPLASFLAAPHNCKPQIDAAIASQACVLLPPASEGLSEGLECLYEAEWGMGGAFPQLHDVRLSFNKLNGSLPNWGADGTSMQNLQWLQLDRMDGAGFQGKAPSA